MTALGLGLGLPFGGRISNPLVSMGAVFAIDANNSSSGEQFAVNMGSGGSVLNARYGSTTGVDSNDPVLLQHAGFNYLYLPGTAGNYASTPSNSNLDLSGGLEIVARIRPNSAAASTMMIASRRNASLSWQWGLNSGIIYFSYRVAGVNYFNNTQVAVPYGVGIWYWLRVRHNDTTGVTTMDYAPDQSAEPSSWTSLSVIDTARIGAIENLAVPIEVGSNSGGVSETFNGGIARVIIRNNIGGATIYDADFTRNTSQTSFTEFSANAGTVTINRSASNSKSVVVLRNTWLFGADDYFEVPDNDLLDLGATDNLSVVMVARMHGTMAANARALAKYTTSVEGYRIYIATGTRQPHGNITNASATIGPTQSPDLGNGTLGVITLIRNVTLDNLAIYTNTTNNSSSSDTTTGTLAGTNALTIGFGEAQYWQGELVAAAIFKSVLSSAQISSIMSYYRVV